MMIWYLLIYLFSSNKNKRIYKYLGAGYNVSAVRVCALAHGKKARTTKDYFLSGELEKRRLLN